MRISDWSSDVCSSDLDDDRAARSAHPSLRHRRDRQRQLAVQEPKLSAVAAGAGAGANEDVVLVDVERVVPFYVPITVPVPAPIDTLSRSEEHTSELQSLMRISYAVFCLKKKQTQHQKSTRPNSMT